jgi:hypothetical protein
MKFQSIIKKHYFVYQLKLSKLLKNRACLVLSYHIIFVHLTVLLLGVFLTDSNIFLRTSLSNSKHRKLTDRVSNKTYFTRELLLLCVLTDYMNVVIMYHNGTPIYYVLKLFILRRPISIYDVTNPLNFIKPYQFVQELIGEPAKTHRQECDCISLLFSLRKERRLNASTCDK